MYQKGGFLGPSADLLKLQSMRAVETPRIKSDHTLSCPPYRSTPRTCGPETGDVVGSSRLCAQFATGRNHYTYCTDPAGTFEKSGPRPSAIVGWASTASRSFP